MTYVEGFGPRLGNHLRGLLAATVSIAAFGLLGIASAAEGIDYNSSRSNKTSSATAPAGGSEDGGQGKSTPKLFEAVTKVEELEAMLAQVKAQMDGIYALCYSVDQLNNEAQQELASSSAASEELLSQLDEAQRVFSEQVASVLSPETAALVSQELESSRSSIEVSGDLTVEGAEFSSSVSELMDKLGALEAAFSSFSEASASVKAQGEKLDNPVLFRDGLR